MARPSHKRTLGAWLNGIRVGSWKIGSSGMNEFSYKDSWLFHTLARPISLSSPMGEVAFRGVAVSAFFENFLPDSAEIR